MLLKIYKTNQPLILLLLPLIALFLWGPSFNNESIQIENTTPVYSFFITKSIIFNKIMALCLIVATAIVINATINKNEFFQQNLYIPSLIYTLLMSALPELNTLHPILISNLFIALTFRRLINIHSQVSCKSEIFDASLFILISGLFYPPSILFIPIIWIALMIFRPFSWKEWAIPFLALGLFSIYFYASFLFTEKTEYYQLQNIIDSSVYSSYSYLPTTYVLSFLVIIFSLLGIYQIHKKRKYSSIRYKKMTSTILAFLILSAALFSFIYLNNNNLEATLFTLIPVSIALCYFLIYFKQKIVTELGFILLFTLIILNNYL
ncbi:MAG: hypothetical protein N4A35_00955 [Flavobacteriales bacterium]|nr:hypothetical protein [Flavobacteriales bacterium]